MSQRKVFFCAQGRQAVLKALVAKDAFGAGTVVSLKFDPALRDFLRASPAPGMWPSNREGVRVDQL